MRAFGLLCAAVLVSIGIGVGVISSQASSSTTASSSSAACSTSSGLFEPAGLWPRLHGDIPYECVVTTRNAALAADNAGQVDARDGAARVLFVVLTLPQVVTDGAASVPSGASLPKGDLITYTFSPAAGTVEDFGIRMLSAAHPAPDLRRLGVVTRGVIVLHSGEPTGVVTGTAWACLGVPPKTPPLVRVEARRGRSVAARQTIRSGSSYRFRLAPGTYTVATDVPQDRPVSVTVVAGRTVRAKPLANSCK